MQFTVFVARGVLENVGQCPSLGGGHSVVVVHLHDDLTSHPLSYHVITTICVDDSLIPHRRSLENVGQCRAKGDGRSVVAVHLHHDLTSDSLSHHVITTIVLQLWPDSTTRQLGKC